VSEELLPRWCSWLQDRGAAYRTQAGALRETWRLDVGDHLASGDQRKIAGQEALASRTVRQTGKKILGRNKEQGGAVRTKNRGHGERLGKRIGWGSASLSHERASVQRRKAGRLVDWLSGEPQAREAAYFSSAVNAKPLQSRQAEGPTAQRGIGASGPVFAVENLPGFNRKGQQPWNP